MSLILHNIICSTRPGRQGVAVANWFHALCAQDERFDAKLVDLADFDLPVFDEPQHPSLQHYEHEHTKRWSESVNAADAFVFVTPEYNFGPPPPLLNALNYVYKEWNHKPAAFVSYGGISGGMRAVERTKQTLTTLRMAPILEAVTVPNFGDLVKDGRFEANQIHETSARAMLDELARWAEALKRMRAREFG